MAENTRLYTTLRLVLILLGAVVIGGAILSTKTVTGARTKERGDEVEERLNPSCVGSWGPFLKPSCFTNNDKKKMQKALLNNPSEAVKSSYNGLLLHGKYL